MADDPPDDSDDNTSILSSDMDTLTPLPQGGVRKLGDGCLQINCEGLSENDLSPPRKHLKRTAASRTGTSTSAELHSLVNENLLAKVDSTLHCPACDEKADVDHVLRCSSCNGMFHGFCKSSEKKVHGESVVPAKTYLEHFVKYIAGKQNGMFVGGRFNWTCASCVNVNETSDCKNLPDRLSNLESIMLKCSAARDSQIQVLTEALSTMQKQILDLTSSRAALPVSSFPGNTVVSAESNNNHGVSITQQSTSHDPTYADITKSSTSTEKSLLPPKKLSATHSNCSASAKSAESSVSTESADFSTSVDTCTKNTRRSTGKFTLRLTKSDEDGVAIIKVLEKLAIDKKIDTYDFRSRGKFSVDLFFPNCDEASRAHSSLVSSIDASVVVGKPEMVGPNRVYFVNVPEQLDAAGLMNQLIKRLPDLVLDGSNELCIKILEPRKCIKDNTKLRCTVLLSDDLYSFFMEKLNGRVSLGYYTVISVYDIVKRCIKCQSFEHTSESCSKRASVCGYCGKNHFTRRCPHRSDADKHHCVNCFAHAEFKSGCSGHGAISPQCPFFVQRVKSQDKD